MGYRKALRRFFTQQARRVTRMWVASDGYLSSADDGDYKDAADQLIDPEENDILISVSEPFVFDMADVALDNVDVFEDVTTTVVEVDIPDIPEEVDPSILERLTQESAERLTGVNKSTRRAVQRTINKASANGYSVRETAYGSKRTRKDKFRPLDEIVKEMYRGRPECIARTELALVNNAVQVLRFAEMGMNTVAVFDGPECGWTKHDDPDKANGTTRSVADASAMLLAHPNCVRSFLPTLVERG